MFVDASAIVAIFESAAALCRKNYVSVEEAQADIADFLTKARITVVPVAANEAAAALQAFSRYGKGRNHPAQLNMGDCFAYAVAKTYNTPVLYRGDDFSKTDLAAG